MGRLPDPKLIRLKENLRVRLNTDYIESVESKKVWFEPKAYLLFKKNEQVEMIEEFHDRTRVEVRLGFLLLSIDLPKESVTKFTPIAYYTERKKKREECQKKIRKQ